MLQRKKRFNSLDTHRHCCSHIRSGIVTIVGINISTKNQGNIENITSVYVLQPSCTDALHKNVQSKEQWTSESDVSILFYLAIRK